MSGLQLYEGYEPNHAAGVSTGRSPLVRNCGRVSSATSYCTHSTAPNQL